MPRLTVTAVGNTYEQVVDIFESIGVNPINEINTGKLGNFRTLTYILELEEDDVIVVRKEFMAMCERRNLIGMYPHGDWMRVYIFSRKAFA